MTKAEHRAFRREETICYDCDELAVPGKARCAEHLLQAKVKAARVPVVMHPCARCGTPVTPKATRCRTCAASAVQVARRSSLATRSSCPAEPGTTTHGVASPGGPAEPLPASGC